MLHQVNMILSHSLTLPDEESMVKILMKINGMKAAVTKTLKAWPTSEFVKMI